MLLFGYVYFFCNVTRGELMKTYSYSCPVSIGATTYATRHLNLYFVIVSLPRLYLQPCLQPGIDSHR